MGVRRCGAGYTARVTRLRDRNVKPRAHPALHSAGGHTSASSLGRARPEPCVADAFPEGRIWRRTPSCVVPAATANMAVSGEDLVDPRAALPSASPGPPCPGRGRDGAAASRKPKKKEKARSAASVRDGGDPVAEGAPPSAEAQAREDRTGRGGREDGDGEGRKDGEGRTGTERGGREGTRGRAFCASRLSQPRPPRRRPSSWPGSWPGVWSSWSWA